MQQKKPLKSTRLQQGFLLMLWHGFQRDKNSPPPLKNQKKTNDSLVDSLRLFRKFPPKGIFGLAIPQRQSKTATCLDLGEKRPESENIFMRHSKINVFGQSTEQKEEKKSFINNIGKKLFFFFFHKDKQKQKLVPKQIFL